MPIIPGPRLAPYAITSAIGAGGMVKVYRAVGRRCISLGRHDAIVQFVNPGEPPCRMGRWPKVELAA